MEIIFAMLIRGGLSFLVGVMLGFVSLALFSSIIPPDWVGRLNMITVAVGVSTGLAVFLSWFKPESSRRVIVVGFILAFGLAILGSLTGYFIADATAAEVRNDRLISRGSATTSAIWVFAVCGATLLSTAFSGLYYGFRLWRYHEV